MVLDSTLYSLMQDTVTIEPFTSETAARVPTYGTAVSYRAQVLPWIGRSITGPDGKDLVPEARVIIEGRVSVDARSRLTLPADMLIAGTRTPPIRAVRPQPANLMSLDLTEILV